VPLDPVGTTAIEGTTDQSWFQAVVDRRAETAAVNAMASGLQHGTMRAISNRIAVSWAVTPNTASTYDIGAASVSIWRPLASMTAPSACRAQSTGFPLSILHESRTGFVLAFDRRERGIRLPAFSRF
jgi:hypothetical protein